ncbi:MAG: radical SAM protein [Candidatus Paceibacterota bacterium]
MNKKSIIRLEPNGAVVVPPGMMTNFIYLDNDFKKIFKEEKFSLFGFLEEDVEVLLKNKIILRKPKKKNVKLKMVEVKIDGLPVHALLDITSACNCNCLTCYHKDDLNGFYPKIDDLKKRIDKLKQLGVLLIEVTGGEPFLRDDLLEILEYIKNQGLLFYVVTNGEFLCSADDLLIKSLKSGNGLAISLDGFGDKHDQMRRRPGLFKKIVKGLKVCLLNKIPVVLVSTLNKENVDSVPKMLKLAKDNYCILHLRPTIKTGAALSNDVQESYPVSKVKLLLKDKNVRNGFLGEKRNVPVSCSYYGCGLRRRISVDVYGRIFPCVMDRSRNIGFIKNFSQSTLFKSLVKEVGYFLKKHKDCSVCDKFIKNKENPICSGFCRFSNSYKNNLKK